MHFLSLFNKLVVTKKAAPDWAPLLCFMIKPQRNVAYLPLTPSSSTSKISVEFGGIAPGAPSAP